MSGTNDVDVGLAILQDSNYYLSRLSAPPDIDGTETTWTTLRVPNLMQGDFIAVDGRSGQPDFTQSFQFGYAFSTDYGTETLSVDLGLDNMVVEITTVPEPCASLWFITLGAAILWRRWWGDKS